MLTRFTNALQWRSRSFRHISRCSLGYPLKQQGVNIRRGDQAVKPFDFVHRTLPQQVVLPDELYRLIQPRKDLTAIFGADEPVPVFINCFEGWTKEQDPFL